MNHDEAPPSGGTIKRSQIPFRFSVSLNVTPEEFAKAKRSRILLWLITVAGMVGGLICLLNGIILISIPILGVFATPVATGLLAHLAAAAIFRDAYKMATTRMKLYPRLMQFLNGRTIVD